jgi:hypothetical protein
MSSDIRRPLAVRQCINSACELRYVAVGPTTDPRCEKCGSMTQMKSATSVEPTAALAGPPPAPWYYAGARVIASIAWIAAIVNVISGLVVGVNASSYQTDSGGTGHHAGVVLLGLLAGAAGAVLWVAVAAALLLLVEIAESRQASAP